jgi:hypothetical protein
MVRVFLSSQAVDRDPARALADALQAAGVSVEHSPGNPIDGLDDRWSDWYGVGLPTAIRESQVAVLVLDTVWDSSSWMAEEARLAFAHLGADRVFFWNPGNVTVRASGMSPYLRTRLPDDISSAVTKLRSLL